MLTKVTTDHTSTLTPRYQTWHHIKIQSANWNICIWIQFTRDKGDTFWGKWWVGQKKQWYVMKLIKAWKSYLVRYLNLSFWAREHSHYSSATGIMKEMKWTRKNYLLQMSLVKTETTLTWKLQTSTYSSYPKTESSRTKCASTKE